LQQREEYHDGAVFWSLRNLREACTQEAVVQQQEQKEQLAKVNRKELQAAAKLLQELEKKERCAAREATKVVRDQMKAEKAAARTARIEAQNTKKAIQTASTSKRKASKVLLPKRRPKKPKGGIRRAQLGKASCSTVFTIYTVPHSMINVH
jgi:hypothetical protein